MAGVLAYLLLSFGIAWGIWEGLITKGWVPGEASSMLQVLYGAFAPALAAFAVRLLVTREGFADAGLGLRMGKWRYYMFAWFFPLPCVYVVLVLASLLGLADVDFSFRGGLSALAQGSPEGGFLRDWGSLNLVTSSLASAVPASLILFGEEFGWRGYLQRRIFTRNPLVAAVITGIIWSLWHLPLNLRGYNFPGHPVLGMVTFTVGCILLSIIYGWLRERSGSIWPVCLAHASTNAVGASLVLLAVPAYSGVSVAFLGVLGWIPLGLLAGWIIVRGGLKPLAVNEAEVEETEDAA
ncbi:MAG: lysostaphin resistance A-like protein [Desulfovibrio sp.]|uniref:CPBP family intramembrane glutamic endopeptidase n=1 Tax=Desulfovibrio sp. 7SRBS1 TaxID=3378064 RepID=UPI003B3EEDB2